jgi:hypothetical protein
MGLSVIVLSFPDSFLLVNSLGSILNTEYAFQLRHNLNDLFHAGLDLLKTP